jgi:phage gp36-like protein
VGYCTQADVSIAVGGDDRLRELTDNSSTGAIDTIVLGAAISDACGWMDGYLQKRYSIPLGSPSEFVRRMAAQEAAYRLKQARSATDQADKDAHDERHRTLIDISTGKASAGADPAPPASTAVVAGLISRDDPDVISRETLKGAW